MMILVNTSSQITNQAFKDYFYEEYVLSFLIYCLCCFTCSLLSTNYAVSMSIIRAISLATGDHRELDYDICYGDETMDNPFQNHTYGGDEEADDSEASISPTLHLFLARTQSTVSSLIVILTLRPIS